MQAMFRLIVALGALCVLSACSLKPVEVINPPHFVDMAQLLKEDMVQHSVVDGTGAYLEPSPFHEPGRIPSGDELFMRLSCAFLYSPGRTGVPQTFLETRPTKQALHITEHGFVLSQGSDLIRMELAALVDWNGDGAKDWLLRCIVEPYKDLRRRREYFLVAENIPEKGVVTPRLLAFNDCLDGKCTLYRSTPPPQPEDDNDILEGKPGQRAITSPPGENIPSDVQESGLEEHNLSK